MKSVCGCQRGISAAEALTAHTKAPVFNKRPASRRICAHTERGGQWTNHSDGSDSEESCCRYAALHFNKHTARNICTAANTQSTCRSHDHTQLIPEKLFLNCHLIKLIKHFFIKTSKQQQPSLSQTWSRQPAKTLEQDWFDPFIRYKKLLTQNVSMRKNITASRGRPKQVEVMWTVCPGLLRLGTQNKFSTVRLLCVSWPNKT